jgi:Fic family protein
MPLYTFSYLPLNIELETRIVLKKLTSSHKALAELKGMSKSIPNQTILINTLGLQEAKDSSAVENIITTHDDLYKAGLKTNSIESLESKEVQNYIEALKKGFELINKQKLLTNRMIIEIQATLEKNNAGFRKVPGTTLKNNSTGEVIYTPPQDYQTIVDLMSNLEKYINDNALSDLDPLIKMAVIHFQFESIHPFYDGNGRTGRIINVLYLVLQNLLDLPILYLSKFMISNKSDYYKKIQAVRDHKNIEDWILFVLDGVEQTAIDTIQTITQIQSLLLKQKHQIRKNYKFYSQDLLNNLFKHPYTKIEFVEKDLKVSRITAANYLNTLSDDGILTKKKLGVTNYYINHELFDILTK